MQLYGVDKRDMNQAGVLKIFFFLHYLPSIWNGNSRLFTAFTLIQSPCSVYQCSRLLHSTQLLSERGDFLSPNHAPNYSTIQKVLIQRAGHSLKLLYTQVTAVFCCLSKLKTFSFVNGFRFGDVKDFQGLTAPPVVFKAMIGSHTKTLYLIFV